MEASIDPGVESPMISMRDFLLDRPWWELVVRGFLILIMGIIALIYPGIALWAFVIVFGSIVLVEGLFQMISGFQMKGEDPGWGLLVLGGFISLMIGIIALIWPGITAWVLLLLIAAWALIIGTMQILMAGQMGAEAGASKWVYIVGGLFAIGFSFLAFLWPGATALAIIWVIGFFAIFFGIQLVILGFMQKGQAPSV